MNQNGHGGHREGAGSQPAPVGLVDSADLQTDDPIAFLRALMRDPKVDIKLRADAAKRLAAYEKRKPADQGKKGDQLDAAKQAAEGRFAPLQAPKLRAVN